MRHQPLIAFVVDEQHAAARISDAIFQLARRPPRIERHHDRADTGGGEEDHRPFGQIAHRQADPIALADAHRDQRMRQRRHRAEIRRIADAFVLIDGEHALAVHPRRGDQPGERRRRMFPDAGGNATDRHRLHLELGARSGQRGGRLRQRRSRPCRIERDKRFCIHDASSSKACRATQVETRVCRNQRSSQG
ncbi:hypothetical protein D9M73_192250 [compost metagenome]